MKKVFSFLLFFSLTLPLLAEFSIKGKITEEGTQSPLDFVNVTLFKQGFNTPATGVTSDVNGFFHIPSVPNGDYRIRISFVGYETYNKSVTINGESLNIGIINLKKNSKELGEVEVVGQGYQMRFDIDKKVFNVDQNIATAGGSATDVLRNIPSVDVDNEGNVSLRKDANVEVWINGKASGLTAENRAQVLQQMPAESIETIEVMTNPSAKFNPEGTAGIINLVLKKNRKAGYYGSVSAGLMYPDGGKLGTSLGSNINYSSSKIDAYANVGYRNMTRQGEGFTNRNNYNDNTLLNQNNSLLNSFGGLFMRAGMDYHLDTKNTLSLSGFGMTGEGNSTNKTKYLLTNITTYDTLRNYNRDNTGINTRPALHLNLDYKHDFDKKGTNNLQMSVSYSTHSGTSDNRFVQNDVISALNSDINQASVNKNNNIAVKADYTNKFTETSRLEAGWQSIFDNKLSTASADSLTTANTRLNIPAYFNDFNYKEQIHAGYLTYGNRFDKLSIQGGLRTEYFQRHSTNTTKTISNTDSIKVIPVKSDFEFFPSLYLSYSLSTNSELQLNFSRRVNRPRGRQINPFHNYSDSTNISYGNPGLSPEFSSVMELNYLRHWDNHSLSASVYYRSTDNVIQNVRFLNAKTMETTYMNLAKSENTGLELVAKNHLFKFLDLTSSVNLYYSKIDSSVYENPYNKTIKTTIPEQSDFSWNASIIAGLMFSKTFSGQITGVYSAPKIIAQGTTGENYSINVGLRKTFFERKLNINLTVNDILNSRRERTTTFGKGFYQKSESQSNGRMIGLSLVYNFGNMKKSQKEETKKKEASFDMNMEGGE